MQLRSLSWLFLCALALAVSVRAQTPAPTFASAMPPGLILVAKTSGEVSMIVNGVTSSLKQDDHVPQSAKVITAQNSSIVLVFSNGAQTQLGSDSELVIQEYLQDPFAQTVKIAEMEDEPSSSRTKLALNRGELVGHVKKLNKGAGSSFIVQTPVGAAGIRGTTFRIVFRPGGTGQAFFQLTTAVGDVGFTSGGAGGAGSGGAGSGGAGGGGTGGGAGGGGAGGAGGGGAGGAPVVDPASINAQGSVTGLSIPQGQEISILVDVTTNAQGQMVVTTLPPPPSQTTAVSAATLQLVTTAASNIAVAVQQTVFTSSAPAGTGTGSGGTGTTGSTSGTTGTTSVTNANGSTTTTTAISGSNFSGTVAATSSPEATAPRIITTNGAP